MSIVEKKAGRPKGTSNNKTYKWKVILFDDKTKLFKEGKYTSVNHINQELNLKLITKYRADPNMRNGENSFLARYGHIQIEKIYEPI